MPDPSIPRPLGEIKIADSRFLGFCFNIETEEEVQEHQQRLKAFHHSASHFPFVFYERVNNNENNKNKTYNIRWDEDDEPPDSVGPACALEVEQYLTEKKKLNSVTYGLVVIIVRYFGERLLGVSSGRLTGCYRSICRITLHRYFFSVHPLVEEFDIQLEQDIYGMGAGDCELILNVVKEDLLVAEEIASDRSNQINNENPVSSFEARILSELKFDSFKGAAGEELPRLQNLQADLLTGFIPVYRYPGNYSGDEWSTEKWSPLSLQIKQAVEERLKPLINQTMNHCVTNYYRNGTDFIAHHGDKDLDLNREGVIVSVSLGSSRMLELRRRADPKDLIRLILPHRSMLVLGPHTNREWTHSILPNKSQRVRISLTMREVLTFKDLKTGRLYGQGVYRKTLNQVRTRALVENTMCFAGFFALSTSMVSKKGLTTTNLVLVGAFAASVFGLRLLSNAMEKQREERMARDFFSKTSSTGRKY